MSSEELLKLLKVIEWNGTEVLGLGQLTCKPTIYSCCPYCRRSFQQGHKYYSGCKLSNLIKELEGAGKAGNQELPKAQETGD
jgi:hypothetical protein